MKRSPVRSASPQTHAAAFTLTEIVLALAVIATAFVAILGLLPAGLDASRQAANSTVVAVVLEDVHNRLQGQRLVKGAAAFSPAFFDAQGVFIPANAPPEILARRLYRADVNIGDWHEQPANTSGLRPVLVSLSWPVDVQNGEPLGPDNPRTVVTYAATTLTGTDWPKIDSGYDPKIEF